MEPVPNAAPCQPSVPAARRHEGRPSRRASLLPGEAGLPCLMVMAPGSVIRAEAMSLSVERQGEATLACPIHRIRAVVAGPSTRISSQALSLLAEHERAFVHMGVGGNIRCWLQPASDHAATVLPLQGSAERDRRAGGAATKSVVAAIIGAKIDGMDALMQQHERATSDRGDPAAEGVGRTRALISTWRAQLGRCRSIDALRGIEGAATAGYFRAMPHMLTGELRTARRSRRPPLDPVNAMLSFGYALLLNEMVGAVAAHGLNPCMGLLHVPSERGRPALALDLMEPLRISIIDRLVIALCNRGQLGSGDFHAQDGGITLAPEGRKRFLGAYQACMASGVRVDDAPEMPVRSLIDGSVRWYLERLEEMEAPGAGAEAGAAEARRQ